LKRKNPHIISDEKQIPEAILELVELLLQEPMHFDVLLRGARV
jgi:hypothetical protein